MIRLDNTIKENWPSFLQFDDVNNLLLAHFTCEDKFWCEVIDIITWKTLFVVDTPSPQAKIWLAVFLDIHFSNLIFYYSKDLLVFVNETMNWLRVSVHACRTGIVCYC